MRREGDPSGEQPQDLQNLEIIDQILFSGSPAQRKALQEFHDLSDEVLERLVYYTNLRHNAHDISDREVEKRERERPTALQEELDLGTYLENIEPQVRGAVMVMRRKGYPTYESGFYSASEIQTVGLTEPLLDGFVLPDDLAHDNRILEWKITPDHITFQPKMGLSLEDLTDIWNRIVDVLPDRGSPAVPSTLPLAETFRERQETRN